MPRFTEGAYGGETTILEGETFQLEVHKRRTGWGWGEIVVSAPKKGEALFAVLETLGSVDLAGYDHPLRLEAARCDKQQDSLSFEVEANLESVGLKGEAPIKGRVELSLVNGGKRITYSLQTTAQSSLHLRGLTGPWLRVGADSFGVEKEDAIFPGIEWLIDSEWSSGTDWFENPEALRVTPHPNKVAIPIMAISHSGVGLGLSWDPLQSTLSHATRIRSPQPVFASPNFIDKRNDHLLGLMLPSATWGLAEDSLKADPPVSIPKGLKLNLDAEISIVEGRSLDVVIDWVRRSGMPDPREPRYKWEDAMDMIASAYNSHFWAEGKGWGLDGNGSPATPRFLRRYVVWRQNGPLVQDLKEKISWCDEQERPEPKLDLGHITPGGGAENTLREMADRLIDLQTPNGSFPFDPEGRHKTNLTERAALWRPLGLPGDTALDLCMTAATFLLNLGAKGEEGRYLSAARRALEFAMKYVRPEGGDWWETPLHSPNLLAAGNAAIAYYRGYQAFGEEKYLDKARHWIRCLLPFTHLWHPPDSEMIYNTKPCFNSTSWFLSDWTAKHVQWEVLRVFARSHELGIDWSEIDPELDWATYHRGVTTAVLRWMIDYQDREWMWRSEFPHEKLEGGGWDTCFCDTYDPVSGTYGGAPIMPDVIGDNILSLLGARTMP